MPLRSPKMYFCIFGFHRLVWWPKCTPASSNSFIVSAAMNPPSVHSSAVPRSRRLPPRVHSVRDSSLRRVFGVDAHVLLAQVARPHPVLGAAESEIDRDRVFGVPHQLADP